MTVHRQQHQSQSAEGSPQESPVSSGERRMQPVARRHALRAVIASAAATIGAALLGAGRVEKASADNPPLHGVSGDEIPGVEGDNFGGAFGVAGNATGGPFVFAVSPVGVYGVASNSGRGVYGQGGTGVQGVAQTANGSGVIGETGGVGVPPGYFAGVFGAAPNNVTAVQGVAGDPGPVPPSGTAGVGGTSSTGYGVVGTSSSNFGVLGVGGSNYAAIYGLNSSTGPGVLGYSPGSGIAVGGISASGYGVYGQCTYGPGVWGTSAVNGSVGVVGVNDAGPNSIGVYGGSANGYAGYFAGKVHISGGLVSQAPHVAAVRGADGRLRSMHSLASPESWFEDFGSGRLNGGSATVQISADFAEVVHGDGYHVFLTPQGDSKGLYVTSQSSTSFMVREQQGGTSSIWFSYGLVAKSRENAGARMQHMAEPPTAPKAPTLPLVNIPEAGGGASPTGPVIEPRSGQH